MYYKEKRELLQSEFEKQYKKEEKDKDSPMTMSGCYVEDFSEDEVIVQHEGETYKLGYKISEDNKVTFDDKDKWQEVIEKTEYVTRETSDNSEPNMKEKKEERKKLVKGMYEE